ncbi:MAG: branched-chain amino acid ABC transporter permease [Hyphomicrobiales bacterium]|nr:MAG: branched-chain amino acid ABC transporter permease [Hyphomicrobiales bacterium]
MLLFFEQLLNGVQLGVFLFLLAAGLTLIFGIMGVINLAHGSLYMAGAFASALALRLSGSFTLALIAAPLAAGLVGLAMEVIVIRRLYARDHLDQVLATFGLILFFNEIAAISFGRQPLFMNIPPALNSTVELLPGAPYPVYRLLIIIAGLLVAGLLYVLISRSRAGSLIRAGSTDQEMLSALGINVKMLFALVFAFGAMLAGFAGGLAGPLLSVEIGMGENILILTFVVIVIGGIGSIRGAFAGALLVGIADTLGRAFLPGLLKLMLPPAEADGIAAGLASMAIYILMAGILIWRPAGLFPPQGRSGA